MKKQKTVIIILLKLSDLFKIFKQSDYYIPLISSQKRKYNLSYFKNYFITDKHYIISKNFIMIERNQKIHKQIRNILIGWRKKNDDEEKRFFEKFRQFLQIKTILYYFLYFLIYNLNCLHFLVILTKNI